MKTRPLKREEFEGLFQEKILERERRYFEEDRLDDPIISEAVPLGEVAGVEPQCRSCVDLAEGEARLDEFQAKVGGLKKYQVRTAEELDALLPSVLDRAFRGRL